MGFENLSRTLEVDIDKPHLVTIVMVKVIDTTTLT